MPLYEYKCDACGSVFEKMQKFADEPLKVHQEGCGGPVHRLLTAPAFQFKGSGWYITDYARAGNKSEGNGGAKPGSENKTESTPKSDSSKSDTSSSTTTSTTTKASDK